MQGTLSTGDIQIAQIGIPGLSFTGLLSVGPFLNIIAKADATFDTNLNLDVDVAYTASDVQFLFPPPSNSSKFKPTGSIKRGDSSTCISCHRTMGAALDDFPFPSDLSLSASAGLPSHGKLAVHLIPRLAFGIDAFDGTAETTIFLDLDTSAALDLSLTASASASASTSSSTNDSDTSAGDPAHAFGGCFDVTTGFSLDVGADADFFDVFDEGTSLSLYGKTFELYKKCFGDTPARRAPFSGRVPLSAFAENLKKSVKKGCGAVAGLGKLLSLVTTKVSGSG